jgi:glycosyltransferase involved in cell wall biosynthesis
MRILFISKPYVARPYRKKLLELARSKRFEIGLICPTEWGNQTFEEPSEEEKKHLWIKSLPIWFTGKNHFHLYKGLAAAVQSFGPDVINVEEEDYSAVTWQCVRLARKLKVPSMFYAWQNIYKDYPPPFSTIESYVYRHAIGAMGGSENAGKILRKKGYKGPFASIAQIGIDTSLFEISGDIDQVKRSYKEKIGIDPNAFVVFYAGRIVEEKGIQTLIEAAVRCSERLKIMIVGSGPYEQTLKDLAAKLLPEGKAKFVPYVTAALLPEYTKAADAVCLASLTRPNWVEQGPVRVVTESMSAKCVAIVSDQGELPEVVGQSGIVFKEGDSYALAQIIERLMADKALQEDYRQKGFQLVKEKYSAEAVAKRSTDFFNQVLQTHGLK